MTSRAVVVGASLAGLRAAEALRQEGHDGPLTVVGSELHAPYDRPPLSKQVLTGKAGPDSVMLQVADGLDAQWMLGARATALDLAARTVRIAGGDDVPFDRLVLATGAHPRVLPFAPPGPGIHYLRTLDDSLALREALLGASRVAVIGAGFIGLEVASSARQIGLDVTVLEALPVPLEAAIGERMGRLLAEWHRAHGVDVRVGTGVAAVEGKGRAEAVRLVDGTLVDADVVVVGVGVAPSTEWLRGSGVDVDDGVLCDSCLQVLSGGKPVPGVTAAGDVARWRHAVTGEWVRVEHWTNAAEQADVAARTLLRGDDAEPYVSIPYFWSDQHGAKLQFVGTATSGDDLEMLEGDLLAESRFVAAYGREHRLVAAIGMRRPARIMALQRLISEGAGFPPTA